MFNKTNFSEMGCECRISNMSEELFNDALYYREMVELVDNFYLKWRYRRSSIISFCASAEAWINSIIKYNLESRTIGLNLTEQEVLEFIKNHNSKMPNGFNNVRNKLYNFIPQAIIGRNINWNNNCENSFEEYIALSNMRNSVIHYAVKNSEEVHSQQFIDLLNNAADIIEKLFERYSELGSKINIPSWYAKRQSRIIE
jgi:hypothetical protein